MKIKFNYYLMLNISPTAKAEDIRKAYLRLARKYHPDKNKGNKLAEKKFKQINTAYQVLQDPQKRKSFDEEWNRLQEKSKNQKRPLQKFSRNSVADKQVKKEKKHPSFIDGFFQKKREEKPINLKIPLFVSLEDICQTALKKVDYLKPYNGKKIKSSLKVQLPKGAKPGTHLQFKKKGGAHGKKIFGNLFLTLKIKPNPFLKVKNYDIHLTFPIKFTEAFKGSKKEFLSPHGKILLTLPPHTKHNHIFRFKNLGLPDTSDSKGNMFVKIFVDYPKEKRIKIQNEMKNLSLKDKESYIEQYEMKKNLYEKILQFEKTNKI